ERERIQDSGLTVLALVSQSCGRDDPKRARVARRRQVELPGERPDAPARLGRGHPTACELPQPLPQSRVDAIGHTPSVGVCDARRCVDSVSNASSCSLEHKAPRRGLGRYDRPMADQTPAPALSLDQQLQEIGAQLAWVRDYL